MGSWSGSTQAGITINNGKAISFQDSASPPNTANGMTLDSSDDLFIGDATHVDNMVFDVTTSGTFSFDVNGTPQATINNVGVYNVASGTKNIGTDNTTSLAVNTLASARTRAFFIRTETQGTDFAPPAISIIGGAALASAVTNLDGGQINITGGAGASGSAGDADGGAVVLRGGAAAGTGDNGGIDVGGASDLLGFLGTTPIALQTGVAVTDAAIHAALVALGLITA